MVCCKKFDSGYVVDGNYKCNLYLFCLFLGFFFMFGWGFCVIRRIGYEGWYSVLDVDCNDIWSVEVLKFFMVWIEIVGIFNMEEENKFDVSSYSLKEC